MSHKDREIAALRAQVEDLNEEYENLEVARDRLREELEAKYDRLLEEVQSTRRVLVYRVPEVKTLKAELERERIQRQFGHHLREMRRIHGGS